MEKTHHNHEAQFTVLLMATEYTRYKYREYSDSFKHFDVLSLLVIYHTETNKICFCLGSNLKITNW